MSLDAQLFQQPSSAFCDRIDAIIQENKVLKEELKEARKLLHTTQNDSESHLGAVEYELEQCKKESSASMTAIVTELNLCQLENKQLKQELSEMRGSAYANEKCISGKHSELHQMEAYLARLPTIEEHDRLQNEHNLAVIQVAEFKRQLAYTQKLLNKCEGQLGDAKVQLRQQADRERLAKAQLNNTMQHPSIREDVNQIPPTRQFASALTEDLHFEVDRYRNSYEHIKKLLEAETHRAEAAEHRIKMVEREFEERIAREEATVSGLKTSISTNQAEMQKLKEYISKLILEKQDLLASQLTTRASLRKAVAAWQSAGGRQRQQLVVQLTQAVEEVAQLAAHLEQLAEGRRLDLAKLLSVQPRSSSNVAVALPVTAAASAELRDADGNYEMAIKSFMDCADESQLTRQTTVLQQAREQVEQLRQKLTDRYADHLGGTMNCIVQ